MFYSLSSLSKRATTTGCASLSMKISCGHRFNADPFTACSNLADCLRAVSCLAVYVEMVTDTFSFLLAAVLWNFRCAR